ncbi:intein splicing region [Actinomyces johnsonii F0542]|uniref:Intein splicing region n=1 Tax=Actinomyces johnsonii F0542 TaxID=1321818 RepID=U1S5A5_9ACTO|nr:ATP-binding protein [Actinomyces johnsonii]ERH25832.1 intein splicing region [Actinomyces johnsonii F0542]
MSATGFLSTVLSQATRRARALKEIRNEDDARLVSKSDAGPCRLPIVFSNDSFFLTRDGAWTGMRIPTKSSGFLSARARQEYYRSAQKVFAKDLPKEKENAGQILVTNRVVSMDEWETQILDPTSKYNPNLTSGYQAYVREARRNIEASSFSQPETYLFVRQGSRGGTGVTKIVNQVVDLVLAGAGMDDSQPDKEEVSYWEPQATNLRRTLSSTWLQAQPVTRRELEWVVRHQDMPGLPTPDVSPSDEQEWGAGAWRTALSSYTEEIPLGIINRRRYYGLRVDGPTGAGTSYVAFLPIASIPQAVRYDANWLDFASKTDFPVDINLHFEVIGAAAVERQLDKATETAEAQLDEAADVGAQDSVTATQHAQLDQTRTQMAMNKSPMVYWQAVMSVYADDRETLLDRISSLIQHYNAIHFELVCPDKDQRELYFQSFPGAPVTLDDWFHRTDTQFFAACQPWLSQAIGNSVDIPGDYQGYSLEVDSSGNLKRGRPFFFNLFSVVDGQGKAPTEGVVASPGAGKRLPLTTPILREDRTWTTMGDLRVGDRIWSTHGPTAVTRLSPVKEDAPALRMVFDDGTTQVCDPEHRWTFMGPDAPSWPVPDQNEPDGALSGLLTSSDPEDTTTPKQLATLVGDSQRAEDYLRASERLRPDGSGRFRMRDLCREVLEDRGADTGACGITITAQEACTLLDEGCALSLPLADPLTLPEAAVRPDALDAPTLARLLTAGSASSADVESALTWPEHDRRRLLEAVLGDPGGLAADDDVVEALATLAAATATGVVTSPGRIRATGSTSRCLVAIEPVPSVPMRCITVDSPNHLYLAGTRLLPTHNTVSRGLKPVHEDALRGVTQYVWDPKGDFRPLFNSARELMLDPDKVRLIDLGDPKVSISLDAFTVAEYDPDNLIDSRESSAREVLRLLAREQTSNENPAAITYRGVIDQAVSAVIEAEKTTQVAPTMQGILAVLRDWREEINLPPFRREEKKENFIDAVEDLLRQYEAIARDSMGRLLFLDPSQGGSLDVEEGVLTIFVAMKLKTTDPGEEQTPTTVVGDTIAAMMVDYIRSLLSRLPIPVQKSATFDEWHVIKRTKRADALVDWLRRMGRSRRCAVRQMSQSAKDLSASSLACVWIGWSTEETEAEASCDLLGIEKTTANVETIMHLNKGEFIFRDGFGRLARVFVDFWDTSVLEIFRTEAMAQAA